MENETTPERMAMCLEAVRYAELHRRNYDLSDPYDAAIYATWALLNPLDLPGRDSIGTAPDCAIPVAVEKTKGHPFTAHAHHGEPLEPSPDDTLLYARLARRHHGYLHFIVDRFRILALRKP